ncbi:MAG: AbrB/MazE/SpoVT family DNA-binding domain-containing protein, partial [Thaumarchaeota archaeon]|nr:AbrB/MazE/SpoVT family DNA-binding domain-containing protein [Nitrososphaerota archaeon]
MKGETRKVQFTGNSSYIVSLPKPWAEEMGIRSGDQVVITRQG